MPLYLKMSENKINDMQRNMQINAYWKSVYKLLIRDHRPKETIL